MRSSLEKKDNIHTTMIHQIKLIISKSGFKDLFIKNSFHSFNLGEWTIQIIKLLGSTFLWYCGTRNLSTLRIFLFFSNSASLKFIRLLRVVSPLNIV